MRFIYILVIMFLWCYGIVNANTYWKYVPGVGAIVGMVCVCGKLFSSKE